MLESAIIDHWTRQKTSQWSKNSNYTQYAYMFYV